MKRSLISSKINSGFKTIYFNRTEQNLHTRMSSISDKNYISKHFMRIMRLAKL